MLSEQDKKWIAELFTAGRQEDREWMQAALHSMLLDITDTMAQGFSECASVSQVREIIQDELVPVKANIGSLEQRFKWMSERMVTKEDLDERFNN